MRKPKSENSLQSIILSFFTGIIFFLILSVQFSCSFKEPVAPKWDVNLPVPLMNRTITMQELVDKNDFLVSNPDGLVSIDFEENLDRYEVGDQLKIEGVNESFAAKLGKIEIPSPGTKTATFNLSDIYPPSQMLNGQMVPVPAFSFENLTANLEGFQDFESILIESGFIRITLTNRLPIPLMSGTSLQVKNRNTGEPVFFVEFSRQIEPGEKVTKNVSLANVRIPSNLSFVITGGSPGSGAEQVEIDADNDGIDLEAYISPLTATEATAVIEEQQFSGKDSLSLGDSIVVTQAKISTGNFALEFENHVPLNLQIDLQLNDFYDLNDQPVRIYIPIQAGGTVSRNIDISGFEFRPVLNNGSSVVHFSYDVIAAGSNGNFVTVTSEDNFSLRINLSEIHFSELHGILNGVQVKLDSTEISLDMPEDLDSLHFDAARLELLVNNGIGFPLFPDIKIVGRNNSDGEVVELKIDQKIEAANDHPVQSVITLDENNSNLLDFLNISPDRLTLAGSVKLGDGIKVASITTSDFLETSVHITAPLRLSFPSQSIKTDVDTIQIDEDARKELRENLLSGKLVAELDNHLPFGVDLTLQFSAKDTGVFNNPELTIGPLSLQPAPVSSATGRVEAEEPSRILIELNQEEIAIFANKEVYMGIVAYIPGSNGQKYSVYNSDYLRVKAYCEFKYHVDPEKMSQ